MNSRLCSEIKPPAPTVTTTLLGPRPEIGSGDSTVNCQPFGIGIEVMVEGKAGTATTASVLTVLTSTGPRLMDLLRLNGTDHCDQSHGQKKLENKGRHTNSLAQLCKVAQHHVPHFNEQRPVGSYGQGYYAAACTLTAVLAPKRPACDFTASRTVGRKS